MILRNRLALFAAVLFVVSSASVFAGPIVFTDTTSNVPGSVFTLSITPTGVPNDYTATLTVNTVDTSPDDWYINYITLHLDGGTRPDNDQTTFTGPTGWNAIGSGDPDVDLYKRQGFPQESWIGFHTNGIVDDGSIVTTEGVSLDGGTATWSFDFTLAPGSILNQSPSIQVGYFGDGYYKRNGQYKSDFTQMSQLYSVPEPSTLILLLSSMGVLGAAARFRAKT